MFNDQAESSWSLGTLIAFPLGVLTAIAFVAFGVWLIVVRKYQLGERHPDRGAVLFFIVSSFVGAILAAGATAWGMYPFSGEYHKWQQVDGTVEKIDSRLISASDGGMSDKFVVRYAESDDQFACDDSRCAQVEEGDSLSLSCKRAWQFTGTDGYDCRFVSSEATR